MRPFAPVVFLALMLTSVAPAATRPYQTILPDISGPGLPQDYFGRHVASDGEWLVVAATGDRIVSTYASNGAVYVYRRVGAAWRMHQRLRASFPLERPGYADAIAIGSGWIAVYASDVIPPGPAIPFPRVFMYRLAGDTWVAASTLPVPPGFRLYGPSLAIASGVLAVASTDFLDPSTGGGVELFDLLADSVVSRGTVRPAVRAPRVVVDVAGDTLAMGTHRQVELWQRTSPSTWALADAVSASPPSDTFPTSFDLDGDRLVVSHSITAPPAVDAIYVFARNGDSWPEQARLTLPSAANGAYLGFDVVSAGSDVYAIGSGDGTSFIAQFRESGGEWSSLPFRFDSQGGYAELAATTSGIVAGSPGHPALAGRFAGRVLAYDTDAVAPVQALDLGWSVGFAAALAVTDDRAVVRLGSDESPAGTSGFLDVLRRHGNTWSTRRRITLPPGNDATGRPIALCNEQVLVGWSAEPRSLELHAFDTEEPYDLPVDVIQAPDDHPGAFGSAFVCSGSHLVVADHSLVGRNRVHFYRRMGDDWARTQTIVDPAATPQDWFALGLAIDGERVAIGSQNVAYVYRFDGTQWVEDGTVRCDSPCGGLDYNVAIQGDRLAVRHGGSVSTFRRAANEWSFEASSLSVLSAQTDVVLRGERLIGRTAWSTLQLGLSQGQWLPQGSLPVGLTRAAGIAGHQVVFAAVLTSDPRTDNPSAPAIVIDDPDALLSDGFD